VWPQALDYEENESLSVTLISDENSLVLYRQIPSNVREFRVAEREIFKPRNTQT
jgi:hypothetical protein